MRRFYIAFVVGLGACVSSTPSLPIKETQIVQLPTSAQVTTDIAGKAASAVREGVLRVICRQTGFGGTGFLHKSGRVLTAAHVVKGCAVADILLITPAGAGFTVAAVEGDDALDLALLQPTSALPGKPLAIAPIAPPSLGMQVATWGYPGGYSGLAPLLSVGYIAGTQDFAEGGTTVQRWVVNAAFNGGNSGGPVLSLEHGNILGVVSSKLAPMPTHIAQIIDVLSKQTSGFMYEGKTPDGKTVSFTEGQLIGEVLQYLRGQVQLVIGYSVSPEDIAKFLKARGITP
jgi:S1-C subfamily serine protease